MDEIVTTFSESTVAETVTTLASELAELSSIDVDMLNSFTTLGCAFIIGFFFFFVLKLVYRLFNMFF